MYVIDVMEWPGQFEKEEEECSVIRCGSWLDVILETSTDQKPICREEQAHFYIKTQKKVEKKFYEARVDHDDDLFVRCLVLYFNIIEIVW